MPLVDVILPQDKAATIASSPSFLSEMYSFCIEMVERCDCVVAILDGPDADSGTCVEIGHARTTGKPVIGVRTDPRSSEDRELNLMVSRTCSELLWDSRASLEELAQRVGDAISRLLQQQAIMSAHEHQ